MTRFIIVRHGQTYFNLVGRVQGWCDSPLTETGIKQSKLLCEYLKDIDFSHAYSSTSERCVDTMNYIIGSRRIETTHLKSLKEIHFGSFEGEYGKDVFPKGTIYLNGYTEYGGESKVEARDRFIEQLKKIAEEYPNDTVLIVSHGSVLKEVFSYVDEKFNQKSMEAQGSVKALIPNCSVSVLDYDGKFNLVSYGNTPY